MKDTIAKLQAENLLLKDRLKYGHQEQTNVIKKPMQKRLAFKTLDPVVEWLGELKLRRKVKMKDTDKLNQ